ncbi:MAG: DegT/DnrJ/EryC1/StrS family aminotransferase [Candidatus Thermoplasmatota archaeon]
MSVKSIDLSRELEEIGEAVLDSIERVLTVGQFVNGAECRAFESEFSAYVGTRFGIGVNSGSDALLTTIRALGIGPGDEVITTAHTFISTVDAITRNGARPILVDIDPHTYCIDASKIREKIGDRTKAILPVHIYGHPSRMDEIMEIAEDKDIFVIEDACQAHGATYQGRRVGSLADAACFSFYPTKNMGAYGDAGIVVTSNEEIAEKVSKMSNYGQSQKYYYETVGINSRLDEIQAAVLRVKLGHLDDWNAKRRDIARMYRNGLGNASIVLPIEAPHATHVYHQFVIRTENRQRLQKELNSRGIGTSIHYPVPVHLQESYKKSSHDFKLPITEAVSESVLSLPMFPQMTRDEVSTVVEALLDALSPPLTGASGG